MARWLCALAMGALCMALVRTQALAEDPRALARQQTFVVQSILGNGKAAIGTGVLVARDPRAWTIVTAAHVLLKNTELQIADVTESAFYQVLSVRRLPDYDLAFIRVSPPSNFDVQPVEEAVAQPGESVWLWGNPETGFWQFASGTITKVDASLPGLQGSRVTIRCDLCAHGDSGAGIFNARGQLVGILTNVWQTQSGVVRYLEVEPVAVVGQELDLERAMAAQTTR